jgi:hypothetical protein
MASHCCDWRSEPGLAHRLFTDNDHEAPGINRIQRGGERAKAVARQGVAPCDRKHPDLLRGNSLFECGGTTGDTGGLFWPLKGILAPPGALVDHFASSRLETTRPVRDVSADRLGARRVGQSTASARWSSWSSRPTVGWNSSASNPRSRYACTVEVASFGEVSMSATLSAAYSGAKP